MILNLFTEIFYQPFINLLVVIYYGLRFILGSNADMGIAVILFTVIIRILLLPLTVWGARSEKQKRELEEKIKEIKFQHSADPVARDAHIKQLMRANKLAVYGSTITLAIHIILALILWRVFAKGLLGADLHLLYDFVPQPKQPFNLTFMNKYDLTHPNPTLNALQSILIFVLEAEVSLFSLFPVTRRDVILTQFTLPIGSYIIFSQLPAGKKLFIITTLIFSIGYTTFRQIKYWWYRLERKVKEAENNRNTKDGQEAPPAENKEEYNI